MIGGHREWVQGSSFVRVIDVSATFSTYITCLDREIAQESSTHDIAASDAYVLHRILHGVPEGIHDIPPLQAFPMDSNLDIMGGC